MKSLQATCEPDTPRIHGTFDFEIVFGLCNVLTLNFRPTTVRSVTCVGLRLTVSGARLCRELVSGWHQAAPGQMLRLLHDFPSVVSI